MVAGNSADLALALQSAKGTGAAASQHRIYLTGGGVGPMRDVNDIEETSSGRLRNSSFVGQVRAEGSPQAAVRPNFIGLLLYGAMGAKAVTSDTVNVSSSSVANPTVITTTTAHGLTSGDSTTIAGHTGSTPDINGTHVATVLTTTTFTIPVNVTVAGTGGTATTGQYTHTFTLATTQPWLTIWRMLGNLLFEKFVDCKVGSLNFQSEAGGLLQVTSQILGLSPSYLTAAEATASAETTNAFVHADGAGALALEGVVSASIESFGCDMNFGLALQQGPAITGYDITEGMIGIEITTRQTISDFALWNRFHYGSATPTNGATPTRDILELGAPGLDFKFTRPGTPERSLRFAATRLQVVSIAGIEPNTNGDPIKATVTYRVYQPSGGGSGMTVTLRNDRASYPAA